MLVAAALPGGASDEGPGLALTEGDPAVLLAQIAALEGLGPAPVHTYGNDGGCNNPGTVFPDYVNPGVPNAGACPFRTNNFQVLYAFYASDAPNGRGPLYGSGSQGSGSLSFNCNNGARTLVDFTSMQKFELGTGTCTLSFSGANPTTLTSWAGYCWFGPIKCVYADNLLDIVDHI
jgi:hypothetical protein